MSRRRRAGSRVIDVPTEHAINDHLSIVAGFCDLLLADTPEHDPRRADLQEMSRSIRALVALFGRDDRA